jgi:GMP synthase (glutamine-hydrolysing)
MSGKRKVLCVQNIECETLGTLETMFKSDGYSVDKIRAWRDSIPISPRGYSTVVLLGGPMAVYDKLVSLSHEQELVRNCIKKDVPVLGICLGSQIIAQSIGGSVFRGEKKEIGWGDISITAESRNALFSGLAKTLNVFHWHGDTYSLPIEAKVLARSENYIQAFRYKSAVGIQFHLEVNVEMIKQWNLRYSKELLAEGIDPERNIRPELAEELAKSCSKFYSNFSSMVKSSANKD